MKKFKQELCFRCFSILLVTLLSVCMLFPLVLTISVSLQSMDEIYASKPVLFPKEFLIANYTAAMSNGNWLNYFKNSIIVTVITVCISLFINSMSGFVFARIPFPGRSGLFALILLGMMIPTQVTLIPVFGLLRSIRLFGKDSTGLINTYAGLIIPFIAGSFGVFLCRQFYISFPMELDDAAMMDGCGRFMTFARIYLPLSAPVLASLGVLKFTGTWNEYTWPLVSTSGERLKTVQLALTSYRDEGEIQWNLLMAATLTVSLPIYLVFAFAQKYFVSGLLAGSIKA